MATSTGTGGRRWSWDLPAPASRLLLATADEHLLPAVARTARSLGVAVSATPGLLELTGGRDGGRGLERLLHRLARELTPAEADAVRVAADPPGEPAALAAHLLTAPTLAVDLARRGVTAEVGVLADAELWPVYQPVVALPDRSVVAYEAFLRGRAHGREVGGGDLFFVAESAGWLPRLDRIARETAVRGAAGWLGDADLFLNSSPAAVHRPQVALAGTEQALHEAGIDPARLVVEVGEAAAATDRGHLVAVLEHCRSLGWRIALDDVAAGWSSRSLLAAVRPDVVKLGRALVQALPDEGARATVRAVVETAHRLGAVVVAEGVETEQLAEEAAVLGADLGQGWLFGRPVPPPGDDEDASAWTAVPPAR